MYTAARIFLVVIALAFLSTLMQAQEKVVYKAPDKVPITADLYAPNAPMATFIILFHQAKYSRGEYLEIAPKLNKQGFNCLAVDLRSGEAINNVRNETFAYADSLQMKTRYIDAYDDMRASVSYVRSKYPNAKVIIWGSSYSASLAIKMAADYPTGISAVVAFSPGEYFAAYGWSRDIVKMSASRVKCPVFITSSKTEVAEWQGIYDAIPVATKVSFVPNATGKHGSKALWSDFPENTEYWTAINKFLAQYK
ncbi:MAG: alpha/beta fold hydrolase [Bacteroidota bacterium]|nr:MAG: alpha/beta fold hydrolase [Bacteroidota bacterium]